MSDSSFASEPARSDGRFGVLICGEPGCGGATYDVTRVVGPGIGADAINTDGTLVNPQAYVNNGIVSENACLSFKFSWKMEDYNNGRILTATLTLNGEDLWTKTIPLIANSGRYAEGEVQDSVLIPIAKVRFARRVVGGLPIPGKNEFAIRTNLFSACNICGYGFEMSPLSFKAMAPIVLIHGWNSGPWAWGPKPAPEMGDCPKNPRRQGDGGQNFVQPLKDSKAPFDCSIMIDSQASNNQGAQSVGTDLPAVLKSFGSRHVNLGTAQIETVLADFLSAVNTTSMLPLPARLRGMRMLARSTPVRLP